MVLPVGFEAFPVCLAAADTKHVEADLRSSALPAQADLLWLLRRKDKPLFWVAPTEQPSAISLLGCETAARTRDGTVLGWYCNPQF